MSKLAWIVTFAVFSVTPAAAESAIPNLLGTWKGESESIVMGRQRSSLRGPRGRAPAQQHRVHDDDRQAGWPAVLGRVYLGARQGHHHRRDLAQRLHLLGRRRRLHRRDDAGAQPDGALLHAAVAKSARCVLHGDDQAAIAQRRKDPRRALPAAGSICPRPSTTWPNA